MYIKKQFAKKNYKYPLIVVTFIHQDKNVRMKQDVVL